MLRTTLTLPFRRSRYILATGAIILLLAVWHRAVSAAEPVQWLKEPSEIEVQLEAPPYGVSFQEVLVNQLDHAGLGGFAFTLWYDPAIFKAPVVDLAPANALFQASGRALDCWVPIDTAGQYRVACASTGTLGVGPTWTGPQPLATVWMELRPETLHAIGSSPDSGLHTTVFDVNVQVTNTCGQPLNDGTVQPIPGQPECQGTPLPGVDTGGNVDEPGNVDVIINPPPRTATATLTAVPTHTHTPGATRTPTATKTAPPLTPAVWTTTPTSTATATPTITPLPDTPTSTPASGCTPGYWKNHPDVWPTRGLVLGNFSYNKNELMALLNTSTTGDASLILARHLIAAELNVLAGVDGRHITDALANAHRLLAEAARRLPAEIDPSSPDGQGMIWVASVLADFNEKCGGGAPEEGIVSVLPATASDSQFPKGVPSAGSGSRDGPQLARILIQAMALIIAVLVVMVIRLSLRGND